MATWIESMSRPGKGAVAGASAGTRRRSVRNARAPLSRPAFATAYVCLGDPASWPGCARMRSSPRGVSRRTAPALLLPLAAQHRAPAMRSRASRQGLLLLALAPTSSSGARGRGQHPSRCCCCASYVALVELVTLPVRLRDVVTLDDIVVLSTARILLRCSNCAKETINKCCTTPSDSPRARSARRTSR